MGEPGFPLREIKKLNERIHIYFEIPKKKIQVEKILSFTRGETTTNHDTLREDHRILNFATNVQKLSLALLYDTYLGRNDASYFRIPGRGLVLHETLIRGTAIPSFWYSFDSFKKPKVMIYSSLTAGDAPPSTLVFANYFRLMRKP